MSCELKPEQSYRLEAMSLGKTAVIIMPGHLQYITMFAGADAEQLSRS